MLSLLPVPLDDLIHARAVESARLEFKATYNKLILEQVVRTICAFANDFQEVGGGYIVLGIEEAAPGLPRLPPRGLDELDLDHIQKEIRAQCQRIDPVYYPNFVPTFYQDKTILVIWVRRSDARPHQGPANLKSGERHYYIRPNNETIEARGAALTQLMQLTSRVSFDDRQSGQPLTEVSPTLLAQYLRDIRSEHAERLRNDPEAVLRGMGLTVGRNGGEQLRNVALLCFCDEPHRYLPGAYVEVAQFRDGGGELIETRSFRGPLHHQIRDIEEFFRRELGEVTRNAITQFQAERFVAFPEEALREAVVNAVYHRGYDSPQLPTRIGLYPDRIEITSYPGPVPGLQHVHLEANSRMPQLPPRNPRVGELIRALRLAETWHTGIPRIYGRMRANGSPEPQFDFDEQRTYFRVTLPAHPGYVSLNALREAALQWHTGNRSQAITRLQSARRAAPGSGPLAAQLIEYLDGEGNLGAAESVLVDMRKHGSEPEVWLAIRAFADVLLRRNERARAMELLRSVPTPQRPTDVVEKAILLKRAGRYQEAHQAFLTVFDQIQTDPKALHELGQTKIKLALQFRSKGRLRPEVQRQLLGQARELLHKVLALAADQPLRQGWAHFDLARVLDELKQPDSEVARHVEQASQLIPDEKKFGDWLRRRQGTSQR